MTTAIEEKYPRTTKALESLMKIVQRELEDGKLKVELLGIFVNALEKIENDGKEPIGTG